VLDGAGVPRAFVRLDAQENTARRAVGATVGPPGLGAPYSGPS